MNNRQDDKVIHEYLPIRRKFMVQVTVLTTLLSIVPVLWSMGLLPWATAQNLDQHVKDHSSVVGELRLELKEHEKIPKHPGVLSKPDIEKEFSEIRGDINSLEQKQEAQRQDIQQIQIDTAKITTDVGHIKSGVAEIKQMLRDGRGR